MVVQPVTEGSIGKKVILLYPWPNYQNVLLTHFLDSVRNGVFYYRISSDETRLVDWLPGLITWFSEVYGGEICTVYALSACVNFLIVSIKV